uniref:ADP-ribosylation factor-like protein 1 n=1 Tax=Alexandrium catenella TaxID=2925 RepID=A0A7S1M5N9_ALECA|mmetsp:Transcript_2042/g.5450  ORF Transcript_2042/g.5450 Transcript_2042/m.5450 type:complete len:246 (+) Transcript_2042:65-802(+)
MTQPLSFTGCVRSVAQTPPFSWFQNQEFFQFLMLGLEDAGKTTFLYRLKIGVGSWKKHEIIRSMASMKSPKEGDVGNCKDPAYHYEELRSSSVGRYGIWEVPGSEVMVRMWPMFYRYLRITAVFFVVDAFSDQRENMERIAQASRQIRFLLNEDELRIAAFVLVINSVTPEGADAPTPENSEFEKALEEMLGVPEIEQEMPHKNRFLKVSINCSEITRESPVWEKLLRDIGKIQKGIGEGSMFDD